MIWFDFFNPADPSFYDVFCSDDMFRCHSGECVQISHVCDFIPHCADGTDEYCGS